MTLEMLTSIMSDSTIKQKQHQGISKKCAAFTIITFILLFLLEFSRIFIKKVIINKQTKKQGRIQETNKQIYKDMSEEL